MIYLIICPSDYQNPETFYTSAVSEEDGKVDISTIIRAFLIFQAWILKVNVCSDSDQQFYPILLTFRDWNRKASMLV